MLSLSLAASTADRTTELTSEVKLLEIESNPFRNILHIFAGKNFKEI